MLDFLDFGLLTDTEGTDFTLVSECLVKLSVRLC